MPGRAGRIEVTLKPQTLESALPLPEDLRQEYLQALGIDSYFPRLKLPGAPDSVKLDWPDSWQIPQDLNTDDFAAVAPEVASRIDPPSVAPVDSILEKSASPPASASGVAPERTSPASADPVNKSESKGATQAKKAVADECRVQLVCIRVNASLAIINTMPHLGPRQLSSQHRQLLTNMLAASGIAHEELHIEDKPFHWPMVQGGGMDNSRHAAAMALSAYLQQKYADWQFDTLLVMGESIISALFAAADDEENQVPSLDEHGWDIAYSRSLDECWQSPKLKQELWPVFLKLRR